jgi:hypothetical protein
MYKQSALLVIGLLLAGFLACGRAKKEESQTQSQAAPPTQNAVAQQPPAQQAAVQAQPAEPAPKQEAAPPVRTKVAKVAPRQAVSPQATAPDAESKTAAPAAPKVPGVTPATTAEAAPKPAVEAPVVVAPPQPQTIVVPSGTRFEIRLIEPINSAENKSGDSFKATLNQDLEVDGKVVVPRGSTVMGKLMDVRQPGRVEGRAALSITLTQITVGKVSYPIQTNTLSFEAEKTTKQDATKVGIGAGIGAIIGAIAGGGKGAAIGAAVGGGAGTATVLATKGKDVKFEPEERFSFVLQHELGIKF